MHTSRPTSRVLAGAAIASLATIIIAPAANAQLTYTFDMSTQGWTSINDTSQFFWTPDLGNPPASIRGIDAVNGDIWFFSAPAADLGDLSGLYGNTISWEIRGISGDQQDLDDLADVMITGGGTTIGIDVNVQPVNGTWTAWEASVDASSNWRLVSNNLEGELSGGAVSQQVIEGVLASVTGLYIRGEYTTGNDSTALDNVVLAIPAEPCPEDLNGSGSIESGDLNILLGGFGCTGSTTCPGDIDGDGDTDSGDLNLLLARFGEACE